MVRIYRRGLPEKLISRIKENYAHNGILSDPFIVKSGVLQGYILLHLLILVVMEDVLSSIENKSQVIQWKINCQYLNYLAYADDICSLSHRLCDLQRKTLDLQETMKRTGLKINTMESEMNYLGITWNELRSNTNNARWRSAVIGVLFSNGSYIYIHM